MTGPWGWLEHGRAWRLAAAAAMVLAMLPGRASGDAPAPSAAPLRVVIESPRDGWTDQRVVRIAGRVEGLDQGRVAVVLNGIEGSVAVQAGRFAIDQVLAPGWNGIAVEAHAGERHARATRSLFADVPRKDLRITLTWDTDATDVDLHVTGPDGETIFYSHKQGAAGGSLDTDVTTGFGPETYTHADAPAGTYHVLAHYYGAATAAPTRITVTVVRHEGTPAEAREVHRGVLLATGEKLPLVDLAVP